MPPAHTVIKNQCRCKFQRILYRTIVILHNSLSTRNIPILPESKITNFIQNNNRTAKSIPPNLLPQNILLLLKRIRTSTTLPLQRLLQFHQSIGTSFGQLCNWSLCYYGVLYCCVCIWVSLDFGVQEEGIWVF